MANEINVNHETGKNLYAVVRNAAGQVYYIVGTAFETWGTSSRDADDYDIALTESNSHYKATFPVIAAGVYSVQVFERAEASPADTDTLIGSGEMEWNGTTEINNATLTDIMECDVSLDNSGSPWELDFKKKGTSTILFSKKLYEADDTAITTNTVAIAQHLQDAP